MMEWTDVHYRTLARLISKHAWLFTEMLADGIVYQKDNLDRILYFPPEQHPVVLQIGGSNLENLAKATQLSNLYKYNEINFNCGCPSPRVAGHGCFGASLMLNPKFVAEAMPVIAANTDVPVSVSVGLVLMIMIHIMSSVILFTKLLLSHQLGTSLYILGRRY